MSVAQVSRWTCVTGVIKHLHFVCPHQCVCADGRAGHVDGLYSAQLAVSVGEMQCHGEDIIYTLID